MSELMTILSVIDGKPWRFPVTRAAKNQFKRGKCWTAFCNNPIWFVHLNVHGKADFGKCCCCTELWALRNFVVKMRERGKWVMPEKGRPVEWRFDEKKISFAPVPKR